MKTIHAKTYASLLRRLKEARRTAGVTQEVLAERLGYPQSFVSKYENGERRLDVLEFLRVVQAIGLDPIEALREEARLLEPMPRTIRRRKGQRD